MEDVVAELLAGLLAAGDDREQVAAAYRRFIDAGFPVCGSPSALWDHVGTALRRAGYDATRRDRRMRIYSTVSWERFCTRPYPPDWPWHERPDAEPGAAADGGA